jgi:phospholipase/carboxylesterase
VFVSWTPMDSLSKTLTWRSKLLKMRYYSSIVTPFQTPLFDFEMLKGRSRESVEVRKLVIVLHGKGDSLDSFRTIPQELGLFDFDFLLLNAPVKFGDGFKWINNEPRHQRSLEVVRDLLLSLVEELKDFGYSSENILWLGHSQGGRVASDVVMHSPDKFLGLVAVSSYVGFFAGWSDAAQESNAGGAWKTPWLITHGTEDRIIRLSEIRNDVRELTRGKIPLTYREFEKGHDFDHDREVPYIREWIRQHAPASRGLRALAQNSNADVVLGAKTPTPLSETVLRKSPEA